MYPTGDERAYQFNPSSSTTSCTCWRRTARWSPSMCVTRKELWIHANLRGITNRGINYWESTDRKDRRLLFTLEDTLQAIDARTGKSILTFGKDGVVDLREGLGRDPPTIRRVCLVDAGAHLREPAPARQLAGRGLFLRARAHPRLRRGHRRARVDLPHHSAAGRVRLRHLAQGRLEIRRRRRMCGARSRSMRSAASPISRCRRPPTTTTAPTASARICSAIACWRSTRAPANGCGISRWCTTTCGTTTRPPRRSCITVRKDGKKIDAVAQATKQGFVFVFDRVTGKPVWPIEERAVPKSDVPGEQAWPTQPFSTLPPSGAAGREARRPHAVSDQRCRARRLARAHRQGAHRAVQSTGADRIGRGARRRRRHQLGQHRRESRCRHPLSTEPGLPVVLQAAGADGSQRGRRARPLRAAGSRRQSSGAQAAVQASPAPCATARIAPARPRRRRCSTIGTQIGLPQLRRIILYRQRAHAAHRPHRRRADRATSSRFSAAARPRRGRPTCRADACPRARWSRPAARRAARAAGAAIEHARTIPQGVAAPAQRYFTDYGLGYPYLMAPPWSQIMAYDLNRGVIKWTQAAGPGSRRRPRPAARTPACRAARSARA